MKNLFFGLAVAVVALGASAFTNVSKVASGDVYANKVASSPYVKISSAYNPLLCDDDINTDICAYTVTEAGAATVTASDYTKAELEAFANLPQPFVTRSTSNGIYSGL